MDIEITNNELLIIRHIKRCKDNPNILKRLVARYWLMDENYINGLEIINCLINIIEKFDLFLHHDREDSYRGFYLDREPFCGNSDDHLGKLTTKAISRIKLSEPNKKFPRYPKPAYFRNLK